MTNHLATTDTHPSPPNRTVLVAMTCLVLGVAFYFIEHRNTDVSQLDAFSVTPDQLATTAAEGDLGRRLAIPAIGLFGMFLLLRGGEGPRLELSSTLGWLLVGNLIWCSMSIVWSVEPSLTLRHFTAFLLCGIGALGIAQRLTLRELWIVGLVVTMPLILNGVRTELQLGTFRPFSSEYRFSGTLHPNVQAPYCVIMALSAAGLALTARRGRVLLWMLAAMGVYFLLITKSRTSFGALLVATTIFCLAKMSLPKRVAAISGLVALVSSMYLAYLILDLDVFKKAAQTALVGRQEQADSLSGRVPLWMATAPYIQEHLVLGYGYETFWSPERIARFSRSFQWAVPNAHCAYLDTLINIGLVGLFLSVGTVVTSIREAWRQFRFGGDYAYGVLFILFLCRSLNAILESALAVPTTFPAFIMVCGLAHLGFRSDLLRSDEPEHVPSASVAVGGSPIG